MSHKIAVAPTGWSPTKIQGAIKGYKARKAVRQKQAKQLSSQIEPQSNLAMRPKEVRSKPTPYIPPHVETQTPAQREASIRALLNQVEATTEPQYLMSNSSNKAAIKIGKVIKGHLSRKDTRN